VSARELGGETGAADDGMELGAAAAGAGLGAAAGAGLGAAAGAGGTLAGGGNRFTKCRAGTGGGCSSRDSREVSSTADGCP
jgi:hypothetical protein